MKIWPAYFREVQSGSKTFELRKNDHGFSCGDDLLLREYDPETKSYTGRSVYRRVHAILYEAPGLEPGYVIMGLQP